jgi:hypothetical protein
MKTLFKLLLLVILFTSCDSFDEEYYCSKGNIRVLNKQKWGCPRGGGWCTFQMYLYNDKKADWYSTDEITYNAYSINDTLPTIVLMIIKTKKQ